MNFLIDEDLPRSLGLILTSYGHGAIDVRDIGLRGARDAKIAEYAIQNHLCILTGDYVFSDIRNYPPQYFCGIVILTVPHEAGAQYIRHLLEEFLKQSNIVNDIIGALAIVEPGRIRIRRL